MIKIDQGKPVGSNNEYEIEIGSCSAPLARFNDDFPEDKRSRPYQFYFMILFTSFDLLNHLSSMGYGGTGKIRTNHLGITCPSTSVKVSKKMVRGFIEL